MNRNPYWTLFLIFIGLIVLGYTVFTAIKVYQHTRLSQEAPAKAMKWTINKLAEDDFALQANYEFEWEGKTYIGKTISSDRYLNAWATRETLDKIKENAFHVWFDPENPQNSTLFKNFPVKYTLYTGVLWLLFFYFVWLGRSMNRYIA